MIPAGKDPDVGEALVTSLQKTKYSIDEKLANSSINIFARKASETQNGAKDGNGPRHKIEHLKQSEEDIGEHSEPDGHGEESDDESLDDSESSKQDKVDSAMVEYEVSDEEHEQVSNLQNDLKDHMKEHVEFHDGRLRRKGVFGDGIDDNELMVSRAVFSLKNANLRGAELCAHINAI